jgi:hypothetical protein
MQKESNEQFRKLEEERIEHAQHAKSEKERSACFTHTVYVLNLSVHIYRRFSNLQTEKQEKEASFLNERTTFLVSCWNAFLLAKIHLQEETDHLKKLLADRSEQCVALLNRCKRIVDSGQVSKRNALTESATNSCW